MSELEKWWTSLKPETRRRLQEDPWAPVPPDLWRDVVGSVGGTAAWWPDSQPGPEGFILNEAVSQFIEDQPHVVRYRGNAALASSLVVLLRQAGLRVEWEPADERRDLAGAAQEVVVQIIATGAIAAIKAAIAEFRSRHKGGGDAAVDVDPEPDKH